MLKSPALRVAPSADGISIWSSEIFQDTEATPLREFIARAFSVREVDQIELRRMQSFGRIRFARVSDPSSIWKKLSRALRGIVPQLTDEEDASGAVDAGALFLDGSFARSARVTRVGDALTTWQVKQRGAGALRLAHPVLRRRRDLVFRLEEVLAAIIGVEDFRTNLLTGGVSIRFNERSLTAGHLTRELEKAWPRLVDGLDGPPSRTRLVAATGLLGLAATGQFLVPAVRPVAVAGVALYSSPNVLNAVKDLRHGQIGLAAMYSTGLAILLFTGMPFASTVMATLMQVWPQLGSRKLVRSQRRVFAGQRRRPLTARLARTGKLDVEVHVDDVRMDDLVLVRRGDVVPVDGIVEQGIAAVIDAPPFGGEQVEDRGRGDVVSAGALIVDGNLTIRVQRTGAQTSASYLDSLLPRASIAALPSSREVERIANRNAKPALALAAAGYAATQTLHIVPAVLRPDYATAPRLSAQLSAFYGVAQALQRGVIFRNPASIDRVSGIEAFVLDDSLDLGLRAVEVANVKAARGIDAEQLVGYALAAQQATGSERSVALAALATRMSASARLTQNVQRLAGVTRYHDESGNLIEIVTPHYLAASGTRIPTDLRTLPGRRYKLWGRRNDQLENVPVRIDDHPEVRPLWVLRNRTVIGVLSFARSGALLGRETVTILGEQHPRAQFLFLSQRPKASARTLAASIGIKESQGGLSQAAKVDLIRGLGGKTAWIGDGSEPDVRAVIAASTVSFSTSPPPYIRDDAADVLLPYKGLSGIPDAIDVGTRHARRLSRDYRAVYVTNFLGLAAAFGVRFNSLQVGLLSQVASALVYARHARELDRLASAVEERRDARKRLSAG